MIYNWKDETPKDLDRRLYEIGLTIIKGAYETPRGPQSLKEVEERLDKQYRRELLKKSRIKVDSRKNTAQENFNSYLIEKKRKIRLDLE